MATLPTTAWTFQFNQHGDPLTELQLNENWTVPRPGNQQVLIAVKASPVNPSDLLYVQGLYGVKATNFPVQAGLEGAGVIVAVGGGVNSDLVGKRVHFTTSFQAWGAYAIVDAQKVVPLHDSIPFEVGAQLTVNPLTAFGFLDVLGITPGEYLVQNAAASALGRFIIQLAKAKGIKTINIVRRESQKEELTAIGADHVINSETEDITAKIQEITGGGAKHAIDAVGGEQGGKLLRSLRRGGKLLSYGLLSGQPIPADSSVLIFQGVTLSGFWLVFWIEENLPKAVAAYREAQELFLQGKVSLTSHSFEAKTQLHEAIRHSQTPGKTEKTILLF